MVKNVEDYFLVDCVFKHCIKHAIKTVIDFVERPCIIDFLVIG